MKPKFSLKDRLASFKYAFEGLKALIKSEHNARIHLFCACAVFVLAFVFQLSFYEWIAVIFCVGLVFVTEIINTVVENVADFISPRRNDKIKVIKDLAAAAVLISAITALIIGLIIFVPKISALF